MRQDIIEVARRIREMREICGFSVSELAGKVGVEPEKFAVFEENGEDIPISVLYHLAQIFRVDLNELMTGRAPHLNTYCHVKRGAGRSVDRYPGYSFQHLAYSYKSRVMEPMLVTVEPGDGEPKLVTHGGQEFNLCVEGTVEVLFDGKVIKLEQGDSLYFNPAYPHGQRAAGQTAKFLTVITQED
ncbi:MAG: cupin domain-containing protein [Oscillospiraceae bacterium]|jgi:quercetin dioxygenase-like cupin family protein/DNA-binding XRE family transcriptional regulator|nr:cupin domain-containing protein [Oscillospiraceae bacterium]